MNPKKYILRSITFANVVESAVNTVKSRETINKPFVIVSALVYGAAFKVIDPSKFDGARMGFNDQYSLLKKLSLLPFEGDNSDTSPGQLWMFADLTDFEMTIPSIYLQDAAINPDIDFPIVHILEAQ